MPPAPQPEGEILPPQYAEAPSRPMPDYAEEQSRVSNRSRSFFRAPGTYSLVATNCAVFLWMLLHGVPANSPTPDQLVHFGANVPVLVLHGEWYWYLTATTTKVGIIHRTTNMWGV